MRNLGFTLLELLVAITLLGLLSALAYRALNGMLTGEQTLSVQTRQWQDLNLVLSELEADVAQILNRSTLDTPALLGQPHWEKQNEAQLSFTRLGRTENSPPYRVAYRLNQGRLEQLIWPALDGTPETLPRAATLFEPLSRFELRYLSPSLQWVNTWPQNSADSLPRAIEVSLTLEKGQTITRLFALPVAKP